MARRENIVTLPEEVDICNAADVAEKLISAVRPGFVVIIDMQATTFCDCAGVSAIVRAYKRATSSGAELRVAVTSALVRRIFGLTGIDRLVDIYPSVTTAQGAAARGAAAARVPSG